MSSVTARRAAAPAAGSVSTRPLKVVIASLGGIGRRHLANFQHVAPAVRPIVWHQHSRPGSGSPSAADTVVYSLEGALAERPDAALVTGPSSTHVETALALARHGVHLLVEKPLADTLDGVAELIDTCRARGVLLAVGYCFRFYAPLQAVRDAIRDGRLGRVLSLRAEVGRYLPDWRPGQDYRTTVSGQRSLGGGVLLELSHEIDYPRWLLGEITTVTARVARLGDLAVDVEDTAELLVSFKDGAVGSIHLDMLQRAPVRTCRIVGTEATLIWDGGTHKVRMLTAEAPDGTVLYAGTAADYDEMYRVELRHFLDAVGGAEFPGATGEDGRRALEIALAAQRSSDERRVVAI